MLDRAQQALHLLALDPVVETTADKNSYGFRQQRSCADAIASASQRCLTHRLRSGFSRAISEPVSTKFPTIGFWPTSLWTEPFSKSG